MTDSDMEQKTRFGLTKAEYNSLKGGVYYGVVIIITVGITFVIVAFFASLLGLG